MLANTRPPARPPDLPPPAVRLRLQAPRARQGRSLGHGRRCRVRHGPGDDRAHALQACRRRRAERAHDRAGAGERPVAPRGDGPVAADRVRAVVRGGSGIPAGWECRFDRGRCVFCADRGSVVLALSRIRMFADLRSHSASMTRCTTYVLQPRLHIGSSGTSSGLRPPECCARTAPSPHGYVYLCLCILSYA